MSFFFATVLEVQDLPLLCLLLHLYMLPTLFLLCVDGECLCVCVCECFNTGTTVATLTQTLTLLLELDMSFCLFLLLGDNKNAYTY